MAFVSPPVQEHFTQEDYFYSVQGVAHHGVEVGGTANGPRAEEGPFVDHDMVGSNPQVGMQGLGGGQEWVPVSVEKGCRMVTRNQSQQLKDRPVMTVMPQQVVDMSSRGNGQLVRNADDGQLYLIVKESKSMSKVDVKAQAVDQIEKKPVFQELGAVDAGFARIPPTTPTVKGAPIAPGHSGRMTTPAFSRLTDTPATHGSMSVSPAPSSYQGDLSLEIDEIASRPSRKYTRQNSKSKQSKQYQQKRQKNNISVRKCRAKKSIEAQSQAQRMEGLVTENNRLKALLIVRETEIKQLREIIDKRQPGASF